ncbi:MAG: hypothetical protein WAU88_10785 [Candidatus Zixiibacteriota bacterium]
MKNLRFSLTLLLCTFCATTCLHAEWTRSALPEGGIVHAIVTQGSDLFVATDNGVFRSSNSGGFWSQCGLSGVSVTGLVAKDGHLFAGTESGLMVSANAGNTWQPTGVAEQVIALATGEDRVWMSTRSSGGSPVFTLYTSTDLGQTWSILPTSGVAVSGMAVGTDKVFIGSYSGVYVAEKTPGGFTPFTQIFSNIDVKSLALDDTSLFAGTWEGYGVLVSKDFASFQLPANLGLTSKDLHTLIVEGTSIFAGTANGAFRSDNGGGTWTSLPLDRREVFAFATLGSQIFAATNCGVVKSADNGVTWASASTNLKGGGPIYSLIRQGDDLLISTASGVFRSYDEGNSWTSLGLRNARLGQLVTNGTTVYVASTAGLYRTNDNGVNWTLLESGPLSYDREIEVVGVTSTGTLLVGTQQSNGYRSVDDGATWTSLTAVPSSLQLPIDGICVSGSTVLAGTLDGIFRSVDDGLTWTHVSGETHHGAGDYPYEVSQFASLGSVIHAGGYFGIFLSPDDGQTWSELDNGLQNKWIRDLWSDGTRMYASTIYGIFVLPQGATFWMPTNSDGLADIRVKDMVNISSDMVVITQGGVGRSADYYFGYDLWRRPMAEVYCCTGTTGNVNAAGVVDISDLSILVSYLIGGNAFLPCATAANINAVGVIDVADLSALVNYLTGGGYTLPSCP